jgi:hypothetical protein
VTRDDLRCTSVSPYRLRAGEDTADRLRSEISSAEVAHRPHRSWQTTLATGTDTAESNREVFIFRRQDDAWKISRYLFNKPR